MLTSVALHAQSTDAELVALTLQGDQRAFRQLVNRHMTLVYNIIYRMTNNHELSEEMTQEAFVKAYHHLSSFDRSRPFKPWLVRIASNAAISALRKQSRVVSLNALMDDGTWNELETQQSLDRPGTEDALTRLERKLNAEELMAMLQTLDEKYRQVLILRYTQDLSYEEIAEALGVPLNTVRTWIKRGLERLKSQVKEMHP